MTRLAALVLALLGVWWASPCSAEDGLCFEEAGQYYGVAPELLRAIAKTESGMDPRARNLNTNGTWDVGIMQINSIWRKVLGEEFWRNIRRDACRNIYGGAYILALCVARHGYNWEAVGCYHSGNVNLKVKYAWKVLRNLEGWQELASRWRRE